MEVYRSNNNSITHQSTGPLTSKAHRTKHPLDNVPEELKRRNQWLMWRYEKRGDKWTKVPYCTHTRTRASTTDPKTRADFEAALEAMLRYEYDGIGFVFTEEDEYAGLDFDDCIDESGEVAPWVVAYIEHTDAYAERSVSGRGVHIVCRGCAPNRKNQKCGVEAYSSGRFFTFTGDALRTAPAELPECQDAIDKLAAEFFPDDLGAKASPPRPVGRVAVDLTDEELLKKARASRRGDEFRRLYDYGDLNDHPSQSEADLELCQMLAWWTAWDRERMDQLFRESALMRRKWERASYRNRTIDIAIRSTPTAYRQQTPGGTSKREALDALKAQAAREAWEGRSGPTDSAVYGAVLENASVYGKESETGIVVSPDVRTLALEAGVSRVTVMNSLERLRNDRKKIRRVRKGRGTRADTYLIPTPKGATQGLTTKPCAAYGQPLRRLRNAAPQYKNTHDKNGRPLPAQKRFLLGRLGKLAALYIERVAAERDGITVAGLARAVGRRACDVRRKVNQLLESGLVVRGADGRLRVPDNLLQLLDVELRESGCVDAEQRDRRRYAEDRKARKNHLAGNNRPGDAPTDADLARIRYERVERALAAMSRPSSGPGRTFEAYRTGQSRSFEYLVFAVAYYYGCEAPQVWREAVGSAYALLTDGLMPPEFEEVRSE